MSTLKNGPGEGLTSYSWHCQDCLAYHIAFTNGPQDDEIAKGDVKTSGREHVRDFSHTIETRKTVSDEIVSGALIQPKACHLPR